MDFPASDLGLVNTRVLGWRLFGWKPGYLRWVGSEAGRVGGRCNHTSISVHSESNIVTQPCIRLPSPRSCASGQLLLKFVGRTVEPANRGLGCSSWYRVFLLAFKFTRSVLCRSCISSSSLLSSYSWCYQLQSCTARHRPYPRRWKPPPDPYRALYSTCSFQPATTKMPATTAEPKLELPMQAPSPALFRTQTGELGREVIVTRQPVSCPHRDSGLGYRSAEGLTAWRI